MIQTLINKTDSFELVRDKIAMILADEFASQQALAQAEAIDPAPWDISVYTERSKRL